MRNLILTLTLFLCGCYSPQYHLGDRIGIDKGFLAGCNGTIVYYTSTRCIFSGGRYTLRYVNCLQNGAIFHEYEDEVCATEL